MSEEDIVAVDTNTDVEETTDSNEDSEQEDTVSREEYERLRKANFDINAARKRLDAENKALKEAQANPPIKNDPQLSEELKLIARGLSDEEIEQAKVVAKGKGIALTEAIKDPLFIIFQSNLKENERKEKAKLGASRGSGESQDNTLIKQDMTREEHQEAFKKVMGQ